MSKASQQTLEAEVSRLFAEVKEIEQTGLKPPRFEDYLSIPGQRVHYPEPHDSGKPSAYERDMERYVRRLSTKEAADKAEAEAQEILSEQPAVRTRICEALKSVNNDAKDLAKIICAALIPLSLAGTIALPLTPMLCLGIVLVVWRAGTFAFCAEPDKAKG